MNRVVLGKGRDRSVRRHHPWIFSGAVATFRAEGIADIEKIGLAYCKNRVEICR